MTFVEIALEVMTPYIGDISRADLAGILERSYATFEDKDVVTPVRDAGKGLYLLELFRGPTLAFKDVALQFLGNVFEHLLAQKEGDEARITILGATSGDTGGAAMAGVRGKKGVECVILFPDGRVSEVQERQMTRGFQDANIHPVAVKNADFDDCQNIVKALMADQAFKGWANLGAVNSINWARILAQITYVCVDVWGVCVCEAVRVGVCVGGVVVVKSVANVAESSCSRFSVLWSLVSGLGSLVSCHFFFSRVSLYSALVCLPSLHLTPLSPSLPPLLLPPAPTLPSHNRYYFASYFAVKKEKRGDASFKVNFVVPTGNFGDILAGFYAKKVKQRGVHCGVWRCGTSILVSTTMLHVWGMVWCVV